MRRVELTELLLAVGMTSKEDPCCARRSAVVRYLVRLTGIHERRVAAAVREAASVGFIRLTRTMVTVV